MRVEIPAGSKCVEKIEAVTIKGQSSDTKTHSNYFFVLEADAAKTNARPDTAFVQSKLTLLACRLHQRTRARTAIQFNSIPHLAIELHVHFGRLEKVCHDLGYASRMVPAGRTEKTRPCEFILKQHILRDDDDGSV